MEQWKLDYEGMLLQASGYSGNRKSGQKIISASSLGNDMLQLYLDFKHGKSEDTKIEASNIGSIFQLGVDKACELEEAMAIDQELEPQYISARRLTYELSNGWTVSGEIDQIDTVNKVIIDNKLSTGTALKKVHEQGKSHSYALQLAVYKFLMWKDTGEDYSGALAFGDKSASYFKPNSGDSMNYLNVETHDYKDIEQMLLEKSNTLQEFLDNDLEPTICADRFPKKERGRTKPMRCIHYCNYSKHCKHYNPHSADQSIIDNLEVTATPPNPFDF